MKKILFVLFLILLLTGCKAKYNLKINFGGSVIETSNVYLNSSMLGRNGYSSNGDEFLDQLAENYKFNFLTTKMKFEEGSYLGYKTYRKYPSLSAYTRSTPVSKVLYDNLSFTESDNYVILKSVGNNKIEKYQNENGDMQSIVEQIEINISLPYRVVRNNASHVDVDTNTYTWNFNANSKEEIDLEYRTDELFTVNPLYLYQYVSIYVYITIFLIITILIVVLVIINKSRRMNKI